jgi:magnesium transporter
MISRQFLSSQRIALQASILPQLISPLSLRASFSTKKSLATKILPDTLRRYNKANERGGDAILLGGKVEPEHKSETSNNKSNFETEEEDLNETRSKKTEKPSRFASFFTKFMDVDSKPEEKIYDVKAIEFDTNGNLKIIEEELDKAELCLKHGLHRRDVKTINRPRMNQAPSIDVRETAIIINLTSIRALVKYDRVLIFAHDEETESHQIQSYLIHDLQGKIRNKEISEYFELRVLEAIFKSSLKYLRITQNSLLPQIEKNLSKLDAEVSLESLKDLLLLKNELTMFRKQTEMVLKLFNIVKVSHMYYSILNDEDDLNAMYLSDTNSKQPRPGANHTEVEYLLEHYLCLVEEISNVNKTTMMTIRSTESLIQLSLDTQRNSLIQFEIRATLANISITCATFITSVYGMNLLSHMEDVSGHMERVAASAACLGILVFSLLSLRLRFMFKANMRVGIEKWVKHLRKISKPS